jgi:hypothetical protein
MDELRVTYRGISMPPRIYNRHSAEATEAFKAGVDAALDVAKPAELRRGVDDALGGVTEPTEDANGRLRIVVDGDGDTWSETEHDRFYVGSPERARRMFSDYPDEGKSLGDIRREFFVREVRYQ